MANSYKSYKNSGMKKTGEKTVMKEKKNGYPSRYGKHLADEKDVIINVMPTYKSRY